MKQENIYEVTYTEEKVMGEPEFRGRYTIIVRAGSETEARAGVGAMGRAYARKVVSVTLATDQHPHAYPLRADGRT